jgi:hypothetical protein
LIWQDPIPEVDYDLIAEKDITELKSKSSIRVVRLTTRSDCLGIGFDFSRLRQTRRRERRETSPVTAKVLGSQ